VEGGGSAALSSVYVRREIALLDELARSVGLRVRVDPVCRPHGCVAILLAWPMSRVTRLCVVEAVVRTVVERDLESLSALTSADIDDL
jgi:hypothetical protein